MKAITENIDFLEGSGALVVQRGATQAKGKNEIGKAMSQAVKGKKGTAQVMEWGVNNDLPNYRERLVGENNIVPSLLAVRRDITLGSGIFAYREFIRDGQRVIDEVEMSKEQKDFFDQLEEKNYWLHAANDLVHHAMTGTEFILKNDRSAGVATMNSLRMRHLRAEEQDAAGKINNWYWKGTWGHRDKKSNDQDLAIPLPVYDSMAERQPDKFIYVTGDPLLCLDEYYFTPYWWGAEEWIRVANCIPEFHLSNLSQGYVIRYHVEYPSGYFADRSIGSSSDPEAIQNAKDKEVAAKEEFLKKLDNLLKGADKAGKALVTSYEINKAMGKDFPGIKITPLQVDIKDKALLELFEKSNQAVISSQGVHPTLANIETQGKLSSGTEIRNAYLMYLAIKTPLPRKILLRPLNIVKRLNGWDESVHFGFRDMVLQPLSEDKTGASTQNTATT